MKIPTACCGHSFRNAPPLLPLGDPGVMNLKLLGQFGQGLVALESRQGHLGLRDGSVIPSCVLHNFAPLVGHLPVASVKPGYHLAHCLNFRSPLTVWISSAPLVEVVQNSMPVNRL